MPVIAKLQVVSKTEHAVIGDNRQCDITLRPSYSSDTADNKTWSKYTPTAEFKMTITNPDAIDELELGAQFLVTFEKVE